MYIKFSKSIVLILLTIKAGYELRLKLYKKEIPVKMYSF